MTLDDKDKLLPFITGKQSILVIDDEEQMRQYVCRMFQEDFIVYQAENGIDGLQLARKNVPDIIISDIKMDGGNGIELCKAVKSDELLAHIPVILLTGTSSKEIELEGVRGGADGYITKPFEKEILFARVTNLLKTRAELQKYFYNGVTLNNNNQKVSKEDKDFLEKCITIVELHLDDDTFNIDVLARKLGMSRSAAFKKIKAVTGQSLNGFIRFVRLRKAAELCINSDYNSIQIGSSVGIMDKTHFREQFSKLYGMTPAEFIKKYRNHFNGKFSLDKDALDN